MKTYSKLIGFSHELQILNRPGRRHINHNICPRYWRIMTDGDDRPANAVRILIGILSPSSSLTACGLVNWSSINVTSAITTTIQLSPYQSSQSVYMPTNTYYSCISFYSPETKKNVVKHAWNTAVCRFLWCSRERQNTTIMLHPDCAIVAIVAIVSLRSRVCISIASGKVETCSTLGASQEIPAELPPITDELYEFIWISVLKLERRLTWSNQYDIKLTLP